MQQATATRLAATVQIDRTREMSPPRVIGVGRASHGMKHDRAVEWCDCLIDIAAALFNVSSKELRRPGRATLDITRVRQIAMYVGHVVLRLNMSDVGRGFYRDRTTVLYACHLVEDMRDDAIEICIIAHVLDQVTGVEYRSAVPVEATADIAHVQPQNHVPHIHRDLTHTGNVQRGPARPSQFLATDVEKGGGDIDQAVAPFDRPIVFHSM